MMTSFEQELAHGNPFVGATPYREEHWKRFYGRDAEISEIINNMAEWQLNILAGESASGKTSLLRAGLIPTLGMRRRAGMEEPGEKGHIYPYPVLVFRDWGGVSGSDGIRAHLWDQVQSAVERLNPGNGGEEAEFKNEADYQGAQYVLKLANDALVNEDCSRDDVFVETLLTFKEKFEGVIIVFDQLEELFRAKGNETKEILDLIRELYYLDKQVRILVSLRVEYIHELRLLEGEVGSVMRRAQFLNPLPGDDQHSSADTVTSIVEKAMKSGGFDFNSSAAKDFIRQCIGAPGEERGAGTRFRKNLLTMQVVAQELFDFLTQKLDHGVIDEEMLAEFEKDIGERHHGDEWGAWKDRGKAAGRGPDNPVYESALERWIKRALEPRCQENEGCEAVTEDQRKRWIAVRIGPQLSSGDYKISVAYDDLVHKIKDTYQNRKAMDGANQTPFENLFRGAIDTLVRSNILKRYHVVGNAGEADGGHDGGRVELVHDLMGPAFLAWSKDVIGSLEDSLSSPFVNVGVDVDLFGGVQKVEKSLTGSGKVFQGCSFINVDLKINVDPKAVLHEVRDLAVLDGAEFGNFDGWVLKGSIFQGIHFRNCSFHGADLQGALFRFCKFENVVFSGLGSGTSQMDFRGCQFSDVAFEDSTLNQISMYPDDEFYQECELIHKKNEAGDEVPAIQFGKNNKVVVQLARLEKLAGDGTIKCGEHVRYEYCMWDDASAGKLQARASQVISCGAMTGTKEDPSGLGQDTKGGNAREETTP